MTQDPQRFENGQIALIALGSNAKSIFGDVKETVLKAMEQVARGLGDGGTCSRLYRTPAFPAGAGPDFANGAMAVSTDMAAGQIMAILHQIEAEAGRVRDKRWGTRTLDLDLIGLGDVVCPDVTTYAEWRDMALAEQMERVPEQLIVPHPRVQDRAFVLVPLAEVAADWVHPVSGLSVAAMLAGRPADERASVVPWGS